MYQASVEAMLPMRWCMVGICGRLNDLSTVSYAGIVQEAFSWLVGIHDLIEASSDVPHSRPAPPL